MPENAAGKNIYCGSFGFFGAGAGIITGLTVTVGGAGAGDVVKAVFTGVLAEEEPSAGGSGSFAAACTGGLAAGLVEANGADGTA